MYSKQTFIAAVCASVAQAIMTENIDLASYQLMERDVLEFAQTSQQKGKKHECGYAHNMMKDPAN